MRHASLEPGTSGSLSGLTRRADATDDVWLLGRVPLAAPSLHFCRGGDYTGGVQARGYQALPFSTLAAHRDSNAELVYCPVGHGKFSKLSTTDDSLPFAGLALAMKPPLVVFVVLQRCFVQGLTQGALRD